MRQLAAWTLVLVVASWVAGAQGDAVGCKMEGIYLHSKSAEKEIRDILGKMKGVSDVKCDPATKTLTFRSANAKEADEAVSALVNGGFYFQPTIGSKKYEVFSKPTGLKADEILVRNVYAGCDESEKLIKELFKDAKVMFLGKGPQKDLKLQGKSIDADEVLRKLHDAGLHGVVGTAKK